MKLERIRVAIRDLGYGKTLHGATYIYRPDLSEGISALFAEIRRAEVAAQPRDDWKLWAETPNPCELIHCGVEMVHFDAMAGSSPKSVNLCRLANFSPES